jgi:DNA repair exonuclease SbcCD ATPase subunit
MFIMLLCLKKYKRLMLSNIQTFEWTPSKNLMIVIGRNGSGKSSVIDQMTPLPPKHFAFKVGGSKTFHCLHNESVYQLHSVYNRGTGEHSFIRDGVELNPGGTFAVQEELCWQEFRMNTEIKQLMTGQHRFTNFTTAKRREWLTRMSPVDLGYAFNVYNRTKTAHRDKLGQIKETTRELSTKNHDLLDDAQMSQMRSETDRLVGRLNRLFQDRQNNVQQQFRTPEAAKAELEALVADAHTLLRQYPRLTGSVRVSGRDEHRSLISEQVAEYTGVQHVVDRLIEELESLLNTNTQTAERITPAELQALKDEHTEHLRHAEQHAEYSQRYAGQFPLIAFDISGDPLGKLDALFSRWHAVATSIPDNADGWMNSADAQVNRARLHELRDKRKTLDGMHTTVSRRIATLKGCEHVKCPNCQHTFRPGVEPEEQSGLETKQARLADALDQTDVELKALEEYMEAYQTYSGHVYNFVQITKDFSQFQDLWDYCGGESIMYRSPRLHVTDMLDWHAAMREYAQSKLRLARANVLEQRLQQIAEIDQDAVGYMRERAQRLEAEINTRSLFINDKRRENQAYADSGLQVEAFLEAAERLFDRYERLQGKLKAHAEWLLDKAYEEEINVTQVRLSHTQRTLHELEKRETTIRAMEETVLHASEAHADLTLLVKALAPTGGLIGTYMMGFMQGVCGLVNAIIDNVWSHKLEVLPSKLTKDELDYNFPLSVNNGAVITDDIADGSDSQVAIVNFAFRLAVLKFLGYNDYPLYLDEFGRDFDEQHRTNVVPFISSFIEMGTYKQIFYISHFESIHGAFNTAEFVVLDPTNCVVPDVYNKNVTLG